MMILIGICSFIAGAVFGVLLMCLLRTVSSREEMMHRVEKAPADTHDAAITPKLRMEEKEEV